MGTNCASLLVDLFLHSCQSEILDGFIYNGQRKLAHSLNPTYLYADDFIIFNSRRF